MNSLFKKHLDKFVLVFVFVQKTLVLAFIYDILIYIKNVEKHKKHLRQRFDVLKINKLIAKFSKCNFFTNLVEFLGHTIFNERTSVDPNRIKAIVDSAIQKDKIDVRSFLDVASYYRRFVRGFSKLVAPITILLKG